LFRRELLKGSAGAQLKRISLENVNNESILIFADLGHRLEHFL
jgi:hypothetical protein